MLTQRLIVEHGVDAVAVEADWPDAYRVNRYVAACGCRHQRRRRRLPASSASRPGCGATPSSLDFVEWLCTLQRGARAREAGRLLRPRPVQPVHLDRRRARPPRPNRSRGGAARARPLCLLRALRRGQPGVRLRDALRPRRQLRASVVAQLQEMIARGGERARGDADRDDDAFFYGEQNARLVMTPRPTTGRCSARACRRGICATATWPRRSAALDGHLSRRRRPTGAHRRLGAQLPSRRRARHRDGRRRRAQPRPAVRERHGASAVLLGFSTHHGTVTAASDWDDPAETKQVRPGLPRQLRGFVPPRRQRALPVDPARQPRAAAGARRRRACSARSASSTGPRPSAGATISRPGCRASSTRSSTSTRPTRCGRSTLRAGSEPRAEPPETYPSGV